MKGQWQESGEPLITVARAVRTRGLKGEIVADLLTDFPERFQTTHRLVAVGPSGDRKSLVLEDYWLQKGRVVLKFAECNTIEEGQTLIGHEFAVPEAERVKLPEDHFYNWELEGCQVETVAGKVIGNVREILTTGGAGVLVVEHDGQSDYLVPLAESIVVGIDIERKRVVIDPPEGLLEL
jgi:16S rRNA processing protein RimM